MDIERVNGATATVSESRERKRELTPDHLDALARGRKEGAIVRHYLDALETLRPRRGRKPDLEKLRNRLRAIESRIENGSEDAATRLNLIQERKDLETRLSTTTNTQALREYEEQFIQIAAGFAERKGYDYDSFKAVGVPVEVLRRAGIKKRTSTAA